MGLRLLARRFRRLDYLFKWWKRIEKKQQTARQGRRRNDDDSQKQVLRLYPSG